MKKVASVLEANYKKYNKPNFIADDPISIPHLFTKKQDVEIMAFFASIFAWGQRKTIINKCNELVALFENKPYDFIINHEEKDLKRFLEFKHRTFNATDLLYFIAFLKHHYENYDSLEDAFLKGLKPNDKTVENALIGFEEYFTSLEYFPARTRKHIASPKRKSACKKLNMFLRWMVRNDKQGVDFGIWKQIKTSQLLMPLDVHVERQARILGLISRKQSDFQTVLELTENLKKYDKNDPVKYDFALFGMGVNQKVFK
ncbi:MAG: TIGR02757 family protein [Chitinophagales bacterium]